MLLEVAGSRPHVCAHPVTAQHSERRLEFITGGLLEFWSLDNPDVARAAKVPRIIVDEAAMVPSLMDVWQYALRPTLADYQGDAWFCPHRRAQRFWQMWQWGQDAAMPEWASWQMPSSVNPLLAPSELDEMRRTMPERTYRQEIEAAFVEDGGGVFRRAKRRRRQSHRTAGVEIASTFAASTGPLAMTFPSLLSSTQNAGKWSTWTDSTALTTPAT